MFQQVCRNIGRWLILFLGNFGPWICWISNFVGGRSLFGWWFWHLPWGFSCFLLFSLMHFCCVRVTDWIVENNPVSRLVKINILKLEVKFRRVWSSASLVDCRNKGPRKCLTFRTGCYLLSLMLELNSHWSPKPIGWFYVFWYIDCFVTKTRVYHRG
jgi:hypothetical protein